MKVSVCVRTYNLEPFVEEAIRSALAQATAFDFEIVVADDASTDGTRAILERLQRAAPERLRLLLQETNVGSMRNQFDAYMACAGDYVALLDGDDYWLTTDKLQKQADYLDTHPDVSICGTSYTTGTSTRPVPRQQLMNLRDVLESGNSKTGGGADLLQSTIMIRRACLPTLPDWFILESHMPQTDLLFQILCLQRGSQAFLSDVSTFYRVHGASLFSSLSTERQLESAVATWSEVKKHIEPSYHRPINRRLAGGYFRLSELYAAVGQRAAAKAALTRAAEYGNFADWVRHLGRTYTPSLYESLLTLSAQFRYRE